MRYNKTEKNYKKRITRIRTSDPGYYTVCLILSAICVYQYLCAFLMISMNDIGVIFKARVPVSPVYINALVLFNGKLLPTFVNHTIHR